MELKRVNENISKNYAKKDEISRNEVKKATPMKWIVASSAGLVTLLYTSPKTSIHKIGVVIGCIAIEAEYNYSSLWYTLNTTMDVFYYMSWIWGVAFVLGLIIYKIKQKKFDENRRLKAVENLKILLGIFVTSLVITGALVVFLKMDINAFYTNGKKEVMNSVTKDKTDALSWDIETDGVE